MLVQTFVIIRRSPFYPLVWHFGLVSAVERALASLRRRTRANHRARSAHAHMQLGGVRYMLIVHLSLACAPPTAATALLCL